MQKLKGRIEKETDKAIYFHITSDEWGFNLANQTEWFPKSRIKLPKKMYRKEISIYIPDWLYDSKRRIDPRTM